MKRMLAGAFRPKRNRPGFASIRGLRVFHSTVERVSLLVLISLAVAGITSAQTVGVGAGSYTRTLPPGASAPPSTVFKTTAGPVPSHKFWTNKYWNPLGTSVAMYPEPLSIQVTSRGLVAGYFGSVNNNGFWFNKPFQPDLTIGVTGLNASAVNVSDSSDWAVDFNFGPLTTRVGRGMPFIYGLTNGSRPTVTFSGQPTVFSNGGNVLGISIAGNNYGLFGPPGSTWTGIGTTTLTCNSPSGANYFSVALLPNQAALATFASRAFSFPIDTTVGWSYNQSNSQVTTTYTVATQAMDGVSTGFLMALYPHQYASLQGSVNTNFGYASPRGPMKVVSGPSFTTVDTFNGILPFLPRTANYNAATLQGLLNSVVNEGNHFTASDTYTLGKQLNRIAQLLPIAQQSDPAAFNSLLASLKGKLQEYFTAGGKTTNLFYYDQNWGTLIGYPASFGSDTALNDHHFHYGYWIHSAALVGLYDRNWISQNQWGGMVDLLRQDFANTNRNNALFPFLRNFDVYAGHSWASGQAPFGDGGNEESTSEAINAWAGIILFAALTGNTQLRDAAIWGYTLEVNSAFYYWFNAMPINTFPAGFSRVQIANLFDGKSDSATWFGNQPEFEHGIEFLPFTGASLYLGRDPAYAQINFNEVLSLNGGSLLNWQDLMEEYEAFFNPDDAFNRWNNTTFTFDGESRAHEYAWIRSLQALGRVHVAVTANWPLYAVFRTPAGVTTHVAFNPTGNTIAVNFSDGVTLMVAAGALATDTGSVGTPPAPPSNLTATATSTSSINLSWTASPTSGVTYALFRSTTNGFTPSPATQIQSGITGTTFSNTGLPAATTFFYRVQAVNSAGSSAPSNQASATTQNGGTPPAPPSNLTATATSTSSINLSWTASPTSGVTYTVFRSTTSGFTPSPTTQVQSGITGTTFSNTGLPAGTTFFYLVQAVNSAGSSAPSNQASAATQNAGLPSPWLQGDVGSVGAAGSASAASGTFTVRGSGADIWGNADGFHYVYQTLTGNGEIVARLTAVQNTDPWAKAGVMVRETLAAGSRHAFVCLTPGNGLAFQRRVAANGVSTHTSGGAATAPVWVRLTRSGNILTSFRSTDGVSWTQVSSDTIAMPAQVLVGLAVSSHVTGTLNTSTFDNVRVSGAAPAFSNTLFVIDGAAQGIAATLSTTPGAAASSDSAPGAGGTNHDGVPTNALVYTLSAVTATFNSAQSTQFTLYVDAGAHPGDAIQARISYDFTGDGTFDRVETYRYFATNDLSGWEAYSQAQGLVSASGSFANLSNGRIRLEVWTALGTQAIQLRTSATAAEGLQSRIIVPFN